MFDINSVINLDHKAKQTHFAKLVGVSQSAVAQRVAAGELPEGGTYLQWLYAYCAALRAEAGGRGGDAQGELAKARTRQANADAQAKELSYHRELGHLIPVEEIEPVLANWASMARAEVQYAAERLVTEIESVHGIKVDPEAVPRVLAPAFRAIADYPTTALSEDTEGDHA
ncbi:hypothetical protein KBTX_01687 [wastewater metagenome]|uniref:Terminase small subunit n=2 Tax=unclassified sequences TaxID=12908 RepID=A0A5B8R9B9_9ZZZZ|nr:hypothetical protein [Arhodomonas sp. KWT]QEA05366.1 hypothetical protein KBTEX_01687 [uncultured organism]